MSMAPLDERVSRCKALRAFMHARMELLDVRTKLLCLLLYLLALFHAESLLTLGLCTCVATALAACVGVAFSEVKVAIRPLSMILAVTVVAQVFYCQSGRLLLTVGPLTVYADALMVSAIMVIRLVCMMLASVAFMHCSSVDDLVGALSWSLNPLRKIGLRADAFVIALDVALSVLPLFMEPLRAVAHDKNEQPGRHGVSALLAKARELKDLTASLLHDAFCRVDDYARLFVEGEDAGGQRAQLVFFGNAQKGDYLAIAMSALLLAFVICGCSAP